MIVLIACCRLEVDQPQKFDAKRAHVKKEQLKPTAKPQGSFSKGVKLIF